VVINYLIGQIRLGGSRDASASPMAVERTRRPGGADLFPSACHRAICAGVRSISSSNRSFARRRKSMESRSELSGDGCRTGTSHQRRAAPVAEWYLALNRLHVKL
jgi:hypothetical protein